MKEQMIRRVMLLGCSNGTPLNSPSIPALCHTLQQTYHITTMVSPTLYQTKDGKTQSPVQRAAALQEAFARKDIDAVFDVSGGDAANGILPFLNFSEIRHHPKPFFGYSDLSVLLNPLHQYSNCPTYYFQPRFLSESTKSRVNFASVLSNPLAPPSFKSSTFLQGNRLSGEVVGGNIRCTLKLIGTPWQPNFQNKILFLESLSGNLCRIETMLRQYQQIGAMTRCSGILLGNFTELAKSDMLPQLYALVCEILDNPNLPIVCTTEIGHQIDSLCLPYHLPLFFQEIKK